MTAVSSHAATIIYGFDTNNATGGASITSNATSNTFTNGITTSVWTATAGDGSGRPVFINGQQMRAEKGANADTHTFTITIPNLSALSLNLNLTNLSFDYGKVGGDTGAPSWTVTSNRAGGTITPNTAVIAPTGSNVSSSASMNLAGNFLNISPTSTTTITFTLVDAAGGNNNNGGVHYTFIDNVTLTGTVIPEPSSALLGGLGMLCLLRRRR